MLRQKPALAALLFIGAIALIGTAPALILGYPLGYSSAFNLHWATDFGRQVWSGTLYPRWLGTSFDGFGAPSFYYYPPAPFWLSSIFYPLIGDPPVSRHGFALANAAVTVIAGIGAYLWLHDISRSHLAAALAAAVYVLGPYQLAANFYVRTAYAEYVGAAAVLPFVLWTARRAALGSNRATLGLAASYAVLIMSHLPTTLIASALPAAAPFFFRTSSAWWRSCLRVWLAMLLGIGIAAIYLLPALREQGLIHPEVWWGPFYQYENWFLFSSEEIAKRPLLLFVLPIHVALIVVAVAGTIVLRRREAIRGADGRIFVFCVLMAAVSVFMSVKLSWWIWEMLPILQRVQFPWRFLAVAELGVAGLLALLIAALQERLSQNQRPVRLGFALLLVALLAFDFHAIRHHIILPPDFIEKLDRWVTAGAEAREYTVAAAPLESTEPRLIDGLPTYDRLPRLGSRFRVVSGGGQVTVEQWSPPKRIAITIRDSADLKLQLAHFHFPTFQAELVAPNGQVAPVPLRSSADGLIELELPAGSDQRLTITTTMLASERWGALVSAIFLAIWMLGLAWVVYGSQRRAAR